MSHNTVSLTEMKRCQILKSNKIKHPWRLHNQLVKAIKKKTEIEKMKECFRMNEHCMQMPICKMSGRGINKKYSVGRIPVSYS